MAGHIWAGAAACGPDELFLPAQSTFFSQSFTTPQSQANLAMEQPQNLRTLFTTAKAEKTELEARPDTNTDRFRNDVSATITKLEECQRLVDVLSLFSSNEPLEDIATGDLQ